MPTQRPISRCKPFLESKGWPTAATRLKASKREAHPWPWMHLLFSSPDEEVYFQFPGRACLQCSGLAVPAARLVGRLDLGDRLFPPERNHWHDRFRQAVESSGAGAVSPEGRTHSQGQLLRLP